MKFTSIFFTASAIHLRGILTTVDFNHKVKVHRNAYLDFQNNQPLNAGSPPKDEH